jgi:hypothetical protein
MVRWEMVPRAARAAAVVLSDREWSVLSRRLAGESLAAIAGGSMTKQAIAYSEQHTMRKLAQLAGRALPCSVNDFVRATREAPAAADVPECADGMHGHTGGECKTPLDKLADAFIAEAERGKLSAARHRWYDRRARQLEARQQAE